MKMFKFLKQSSLSAYLAFKQSCENVWGLLKTPKVALSVLVCNFLFHASIAQAGILSQNICRPYRQLVDNELFDMAAVIAAVVLVVSAKISGTHNKALQGGIAIVAALAVAVNIENLVTMVSGTPLGC